MQITTPCKSLETKRIERLKKTKKKYMPKTRHGWGKRENRYRILGCAQAKENEMKGENKRDDRKMRIPQKVVSRPEKGACPI